MLNYELIDSMDFYKEFDENDQKQLDKFLSQKLDTKAYGVIFKDKIFYKTQREGNILELWKRDGL